MALVALEHEQRARGVDAEVPLQEVGAVEGRAQRLPGVVGVGVPQQARDVHFAVQRHREREAVVGDGDGDVRVRLVRAAVREQPGEAVVEPPAVRRADVVAPPVVVAVFHRLDGDAFVRAHALHAGVRYLVVVHPGERPHGVAVDGELPEPAPHRSRPARLVLLDEFALKARNLATQVEREREALGVPGRHGRALARPVDVHLRPAAVAVREAVAAEHEHVAGFEGVEVALVELADPLVVAADVDVHGERVRDGAEILEEDGSRQPAALPNQSLADVEFGVVVLAVRGVVLVAPDLRVDVPVLEALVVGSEVANQRLVVGLGVLAVGVRRAQRRLHLGFPERPLDCHPVDVLGGDVLAALGDVDAVHEPPLGLPQHHRALHEFVPVERDDATRHRPPWPVARPPDALQEARDRFGGTDLHYEVDVRHVDAQFEARRRRRHVQRPLLELGLDGLPAVLREAAVVAGRPVLVDDAALPQILEDALGARPRVREHERALVVAD